MKKFSQIDICMCVVCARARARARARVCVCVCVCTAKINGLQIVRKYSIKNISLYYIQFN